MEKNKFAGLRNVRFVLEITAFIGIVCLIVTFAMTASVLPLGERTGSGLVGALGARTVLFLIFAIGGALTGALFLLSRFPRLYKYPVEINAGNVEIQYHIAKLALCVGQLITLIVSCLLMIKVYNQSIRFFSTSFLEIVLVGIAAYASVFLIYYFTARRFK